MRKDDVIFRGSLIVGCPDVWLAARRFLKLDCVMGVRIYSSSRLMLIWRDPIPNRVFDFHCIDRTFNSMYKQHPFCNLSFYFAGRV